MSLKVDRSPGAAHVIDTIVGDNFCCHLPLTSMLVLIYKHCPVCKRNDVFGDLALSYMFQVSCYDGYCVCSDELARISRPLVDNIESLRIPGGLSACEQYDYIKVAICDFIYSKFYSMFN